MLFISSLLFSTFNSFGSGQTSDDTNRAQHHFATKHDVGNDNSNQSVFEENENEKNENVLQSHILTLPFLISFFQFEVSDPHPAGYQLLAANPANPIYISVCNFRI